MRSLGSFSNVKDPLLPMVGVPCSRYKFGNWKAVASPYSWKVAEFDINYSYISNIPRYFSFAAYHKLRKTFGKFVGSYSDLLSKWWNIVWRICYGRNLSPGILRLASLQTKEDQMWIEFRLIGLENCQTPSTSKVWPIDHREDHRSCTLPFYNLVHVQILYFALLQPCTCTDLS